MMSDIVKKLTGTAKRVYDTIKKKEAPAMQFPIRSLTNVEYNEKDPEGIKKEQDFKALKALLDEMVPAGILVIVGKNENGDYSNKAASDK